MLKKSLAAVAALMAINAAGAAPMYYAFEWKGFNTHSTSPVDSSPIREWAPNATIAGYFKADDLNGDNIITGGELEWFGIKNDGTVDQMMGCPSSESGAWGLTDCWIGNFSYEKGGKLTFSAGAAHAADGSIYRYLSWDMPAGGYYNRSNDVCCGDSWMDPTEQTRFTMIASVPEPSTWAMVGAGLLVAGGAARRRSRTR